MKIRVNDKVKIIAGKDKGKEGTVLKLYKNKNKVLVEGVNVVKKHVKPGVVSKEGGIISLEKPVDASNVMVINPKSGNPERVKYNFVKGKKIRVGAKSNEAFDE